MPRLNPVTLENADTQQSALLNGVAKKLGRVPNLLATMAHSPAVLNSYLGLSQSVSSGTLTPRVREQISLAVGEANSCGYCVAAHTAIGKSIGLADEETIAARKGAPADPKERTAIEFAIQIVSKRGFVTDADVQEVREAGYTDGEIAEIVTAVALNIFTNYFNHVAGTEVDFPAVLDLVEV